MSEYDESAEQDVPTPQDPQVDIGEGPEPVSEDDLELSTPGFTLDDDPLPATGEEADATRSEWQNESAPDTGQRELSAAPESTMIYDLSRCSHIAAHAVDHVESAKGLRKHGLPADILSTDVRLTVATGPMVMAGLRLLQYFAPVIKDDVQLFLEGIQVPTPTPEELELLSSAAEAYAEEQMSEFMSGLQSAGFQTVSEDELLDLSSDAQLERQGGDASLN